MQDRVRRNAGLAAEELSKSKSSGAEPPGAPVFIHAAPRTSSTWFWSRFRANPATCCYYEPFNEGLVYLTPSEANELAHNSWESRHPATDPYCREYGPLIQKTNGVELFDQAMDCEWFIPE